MKITEYRGVPLENYTKKELIAIVKELGHLLEDTHKEHQIVLNKLTERIK